MKTYLVGGAVRDQLLGITPQERDWVVVGATPEAMLAAGFQRADADFPVFLHPETKEEYALARTEIKSGHGYKGFEVEAGPEVTLEQDLARRDLTINAIAKDEDGRLVDPFNGQADLKNKILHHITPAFVEDPLRILRLARFTAQLGELGFTVAPGTETLTTRMSQYDELKTLKPERLWKEMKKALGTSQPWRFFELLQTCGALTYLIPPLAQSLEQEAPGPLESLQRASSLSSDPRVRFAALMQGAAETTKAANSLCTRLRVEKDFTQLLKRVVQLGPGFIEAAESDAGGLMPLLEEGRALQQTDSFQHYLLTCSAIWPETADISNQRIQLAVTAAKSVQANQLIKEGLSGPALGQALTQRRIEAIQKALEGDTTG